MKTSWQQHRSQAESNPGIRGTEDTWKSNRIAIKFDQPSISWPGEKKEGRPAGLDQSGQ